jgi:Ala-tRNA(Pro) deacylase
MSIAQRVKDYLDERGVPFTYGTHRLAYTAQEVAAAQHVPGREVAKVVVLRADDRFIMVVLPAVKKLDLEALRGEIPFHRIRMAREDEFASLFPDSYVGAMAPFGNLYGLPVYVDRSLSTDEEIVFNAGSHLETLRMKYSDFVRLVNPVVIEAGVPIQAH